MYTKIKMSLMNPYESSLFSFSTDLSLYICNVILSFFHFGAEALLQPASHPSVTTMGAIMAANTNSPGPSEERAFATPAQIPQVSANSHAATKNRRTSCFLGS